MLNIIIPKSNFKEIRRASEQLLSVTKGPHMPWLTSRELEWVTGFLVFNLAVLELSRSVHYTQHKGQMNASDDLVWTKFI